MKLLPELSVIIPVLNDSEALKNLAASLNTQQQIELEVIVVDGGKTNVAESCASKLICDHHGFGYFISESGRGKQMNLGRGKARSNTFLFLHADSEFRRMCNFERLWMPFKLKKKSLVGLPGISNCVFKPKIFKWIS